MTSVNVIGPEGRDPSESDVEDGESGADDAARGFSVEELLEEGEGDVDLHPATNTVSDPRHTAKRT